MTDLQKFKNFFDDMNIEYDVTEKSNGVKVLTINDKHIYYSYSNTIEVLFEPKHEDFIEFEALGE